MANYPKKMKDPTEAALSAIQEALNIRDEEAAPATQPGVIPDPLGSLEEPAAHNDPVPPALDEAFEPGEIGSRGTAPVLRAANDDQQSIGQILQTLQRRPPRTSYFVATVFSAVWVVGCLSLSFAYLSEISAAAGPGHSSAALMIGLAAAVLLPIVFFFGVAHMAWRSQELRLIAQSMAQVAVRLAEPESVARDSIVTVGQAIRREVAAMGDGVERALARAGELETLVQNEVAALERTYGDNEIRIRGLLQELTNQRDTLVGQAEQVRSAINNVHIDLTQDLSTISDLVGQQVNDAAQRITHSLAEKGEQITLALGEVGDGMIQQLNARGNELLTRLEAASDETARAIATASDQLTTSLNFKTDHIGDDFAAIAQGLEDMMTSRLERVTDGFSERSLTIVDTMVNRSQELTDLVSGRAQELTEAIIDTSSQIAETIATRADEVNSTLKTAGESLMIEFSERGADVAKKLEDTGSQINDVLADRGSQITETLTDRGNQITETLVDRSNQITEALIARSTNVTDSVRASADQLVDIIAARSDAVKEMLSTRLAAFENVFDHSGAELGEKISRDATTLGNLITRHLAEFDRTVKTYGAELVERLGARTQDVTESMRGYVDNFDTRVTSKAEEVTSGLDVRLTKFQEALDGRTQTLTDALAARVLDIARTLAEGGKDVVTALDKRIADVTTLIDTQAAKLGDTVGSRVSSLDQTIGSRIAQLDQTVGGRSAEVTASLDGRIGQLERLLIGRTETVTQELEAKSRAAAELLSARLIELAEAISTNSGVAERSLQQLAASTNDALSKNAAASAAAAEALNRSASDATLAMGRSAGALTKSIGDSVTAANENIGKSATAASAAVERITANAADLVARSAAAANAAIDKTSTAAADLITRNAAAASEALGKNIAEASTAIGRSTETANEAITRYTAVAGEAIGKTTASATDLITKSAQATTQAIAQSASDAERKLTGMSEEVARAVTGRADDIHAAVNQRLGDMTRLLDDKSNALLVALDGKGQAFAGEVGRVTDHAVKSIEAKSFVFTQTMMDNSEELARIINEASQNATTAMTVSLGRLQDGAKGAADGAKSTIARTLEELHAATRAAVEESKQTASATVADMLETHGMLRSDSTALFERLREANILLQEVLSGAHENMNSIEHTMATRVSEFVAAMNDLTSKSGATTAKVEQHLGSFNSVTGKVLTDLGELATQFDAHGRSLAEAVELLEKSNRRSEDSVTNRNAIIETLLSTLDARSDDFEQRLQRFSGLLEESLDAATTRTREIASLIAESSNESVQSIEQQFELVRSLTQEERKRTGDELHAVYSGAATEVQAMFNQSAERFAEIVQGMKLMAAEMQRELETTRVELRRGVLELPQETAESAAQMRRVIVEQIEALAELNRIVARHGRSLDTTEPVRREMEPAFAAGGGRAAQVRPIRPEPAPPQPTGLRDITGAPPRRPPAEPPAHAPASPLPPAPGGNGRNGGWLSELLTRASREESPPIAPPLSRGEERRDTVESLDSLSVDIARMIDHEAAADLWERYKRGERGVFTRRLYTSQGQKAFDEIRTKYRTDPEFRQTVEHYIHEFERLLEDVSRGERGAAIARNYLTSDTGKVYTMLAHAAGRFDQ